MKNILKVLSVILVLVCVLSLCSCMDEDDSILGNNNGGNNAGNNNAGDNGDNEIVDPDNCNHVYDEWRIIKEVECTVNGKRKHECTLCGNVEEETIEKTGHKFGETTVVKAATCEEDGKSERVCSACKYKETETIKASHNYDAANDNVCKTCGSRKFGTKGLLFTALRGDEFGIAYQNIDYSNAYMVAIGTAVTEKNIEIPAEYNGKPVIAIAEEGFAGHEIEAVIIPASVKIIGENAFKDCASLTSLTIKSGTQLDTLTGFMNCTSLKSFKVTKGIRNISQSAFMNCTALERVSFEDTSNWKSASNGAPQVRDADVSDAVQNGYRIKSGQVRYVWVG